VNIYATKPRLGRKAAQALAGTLLAAMLAALAFAFAGCAGATSLDSPRRAEFEAALCERRAELEERAPSTGRIHLFGETHGNAAHLGKQLELWRDFYENDGMRHLFLEMPFFTAGFLNEWMRDDGDDIFDAVFADLRGTLAHNPHAKEFLRRIKAELPETVFHGTDVGHQYWSTGARFLAHLRESGQESGETYLLALENIEQGRMYYDYRMNVSARADMMAVNFIRAFDALGGESVMSAFYGAQHVAFGRYSRRGGRGATLATQLRARYGDNLGATLLRDIVGGSD